MIRAMEQPHVMLSCRGRHFGHFFKNKFILHKKLFEKNYTEVLKLSLKLQVVSLKLSLETPKNEANFTIFLKILKIFL